MVIENGFSKPIFLEMACTISYFNNMEIIIDSESSLEVSMLAIHPTAASG